MLGTEDMKSNKSMLSRSLFSKLNQANTKSNNLSHTKITELRCCQIEKAQGKGR